MACCRTACLKKMTLTGCDMAQKARKEEEKSQKRWLLPLLPSATSISAIDLFPQSKPVIFQSSVAVNFCFVFLCKQSAATYIIIKKEKKCSSKVTPRPWVLVEFGFKGLAELLKCPFPAQQRHITPASHFLSPSSTSPVVWKIYVKIQLWVLSFFLFPPFSPLSFNPLLMQGYQHHHRPSRTSWYSPCQHRRGSEWLAEFHTLAQASQQRLWACPRNAS